MIYFPQLKAALVVRCHRPEGGKFITRLGVQSVYLVPTEEPPEGAEVASGHLGGWNFPNGKAVSLVYASTLAKMEQFREKERGVWVVPPRLLLNNKYCGLLMTRTNLLISMGCTPLR